MVLIWMQLNVGVALVIPGGSISHPALCKGAIPSLVTKVLEDLRVPMQQVLPIFSRDHRSAFHSIPTLDDISHNM